MKLGTKDLKNSVYLIAEAGSNHDGSLRRAKKLVRAAAESGADAVKFQLFSLDTLIQPEAFERVLGMKDTSWRENFRKLEFPLAWLPVLKKYAEAAGVDFLCTPFDRRRMQLYLDTCPVAVKVASGDLTTAPLLVQAGKSGLPVLLSTGASDNREITAALKLTGKKKTVLLDCVMAYPADASSYGLKRMEDLEKTFRVPVGLSDHTTSAALPALAVSRGMCVVERHFTLDRTRKGGDHHMSTDPAGFRLLAETVRDAAALRREKPGKRPDRKERVFARRALYAAEDIAAGTVLTEENCIPLRPADRGIPAAEIGRILGCKAGRSYTRGELIRRPGR